jgi:hypothetical protein
MRYVAVSPRGGTGAGPGRRAEARAEPDRGGGSGARGNIHTAYSDLFLLFALRAGCCDSRQRETERAGGALAPAVSRR